MTTQFPEDTQLPVVLETPPRQPQLRTAPGAPARRAPQSKGSVAGGGLSLQARMDAALGGQRVPLSPLLVPDSEDEGDDVTISRRPASDNQARKTDEEPQKEAEFYGTMPPEEFETPLESAKRRRSSDDKEPAPRESEEKEEKDEEEEASTKRLRGGNQEAEAAKEPEELEYASAYEPDALTRDAVERCHASSRPSTFVRERLEAFARALEDEAVTRHHQKSTAVIDLGARLEHARVTNAPRAVMSVFQASWIRAEVEMRAARDELRLTRLATKGLVDVMQTLDRAAAKRQ